MKWSSLFAVCALATLAMAPLAACSSSSTTSGSSSSGGTVGETVSVPVSAAAGGTVADKAGSVSLVIPPGALEKDTTITLAVGASAAGTIANVYDFGPDGLKFLKPVALEIKATVPEGKQAAVAYEEAGTWKQLSGSSVDKAKGTVKANTDHFTKYSIVIVDGQAVVSPPASCTEAKAQFTACGGDPKGTWTFAEFCIDGSSSADPFDGKCPTATASFDFTDSRTVVIDATSISNGAGSVSIKQQLTIPGSCLSANNVTCDKIADPEEGRTCALVADACVCNAEQVEQKTPKVDTYTTSGNTITITDTSDNSTTTGEYCVKSNLLYFKETGGDGVLYVLQKK